MRELRATGFMHNRVRMVVASFLCKHLLIDWRWGEAWFARWLMDFELASNNGNWQWAAGTGCDATSYLRVFNPALQLQRFDPQMGYVLKWAPEYCELEQPKPIVQGTRWPGTGRSPPTDQHWRGSDPYAHSGIAKCSTRLFK